MKKIFSVIIHIFGVFLFIMVTGYALLTAYGYQVDLLHRNIIKTSILDIDNKVENISVFLDDKFITDRLPVQVKNLKPGTYNLSVFRPGYKKWEKDIQIKEDVVTKTNDIIMIPEDMKNMADLINKDIKYTDIVNNGKYILFNNKNSDKMHLYEFYDNENYSIDNINYNFEDVTGDIYFADSERIAIPYEANLQILNLRDKNNTNIAVPDEFEDLHVLFAPQLTAFYLNSGAIHSAEILENGSIKSNKLLYECNEDPLESLKVKKFGNSVFLMTENKLFIFENQKVRELDENVIKGPVIEGSDIYYIKKGNELIKLNIDSGEKQLLARFSSTINNYDIHETQKHIFLQKDGVLSVCDLEFNNCFELINVEENQSIIFMNKTGGFILADQSEIKRYSL